jgi:Pyridoxamine 5'-phosphate oxidase
VTVEALHRAMSTVTTSIDELLATWIAARPQAFVVATAPLSRDGRLAVAPKPPPLAVLGARRLAFLDRAGADTVAHVRENGRIAVLLEAGACHVRVQGTARVACRGGEDFGALTAEAGFAAAPAGDAVIVLVDVGAVTVTGPPPGAAPAR